MKLKSNTEITLNRLSGKVEKNTITLSAANETALIEISQGKIVTIDHKFNHTNKRFEKPTKDIIIGERAFRRRVEHFVLKGSNTNNLMRIGQTFHLGDGGTWSSLPHDFENTPEPGFEELFIYLLDGGSKRAIQVGKGLLHTGEPIDACWTVNHMDISQIPMGYHPVVGEPDVIVSYIWCYLCTKDEWEKI